LRAEAVPGQSTDQGCLRYCFHAKGAAGRVSRKAPANALEYDRLMADSYRRHALIEAPIEDVWSIVSDPRTHPDWWPDVIEVRASGPPTEGEKYWRASRRLGFLDQVDGIWVVERLEHLKEAHFRCTVSGSYTRFALTPAQDQTFLEIEAGMLPPNLRWRLAKTMSRLYFVRWLREVLDALPRVVRAGAKPVTEDSSPPPDVSPDK
jgi:Polyketide cyclase / dehydrase and lipid transport